MTAFVLIFWRWWQIWSWSLAQLLFRRLEVLVLSSASLRSMAQVAFTAAARAQSPPSQRLIWAGEARRTRVFFWVARIFKSLNAILDYYEDYFACSVIIGVFLVQKFCWRSSSLCFLWFLIYWWSDSPVTKDGAHRGWPCQILCVDQRHEKEFFNRLCGRGDHVSARTRNGP